MEDKFSRFRREHNLDPATDFGGSGSLETNVVEIPYSASITLDTTLGNHFRITLSGDTTLNAPTGLTEGQKILLEFVNSDGGAKTISVDSIFKFSSSVYSSIEISTAVGAVDYYGCVANKETDAIRMIARAQGF